MITLIVEKGFWGFGDPKTPKPLKNSFLKLDNVYKFNFIYYIKMQFYKKNAGKGRLSFNL